MNFNWRFAKTTPSTREPPVIDPPLVCCRQVMTCVRVRPGYAQTDFIYMCESCNSRTTVVDLQDHMSASGA